MTSLLIIKALVLSFAWTIGSLIFFASRLDDPTPRRVLIMFAPWLGMIGYFIIFYWG